MSNEVRYEMSIRTRTNEYKLKVGTAIHEQLKGNKDYIDNNIVLNIDEDCLVLLTVMEDCKKFPKVVLPFNFNDKLTELTSYLDSEVNSDRWMKQDENCNDQYLFSRACMDLIIGLPTVPYVLLKDKSRYIMNPESFPGKNKLNKCFKILSLPYTIISEQRRYEGIRKTCWKLIKLEGTNSIFHQY